MQTPFHSDINVEVAYDAAKPKIAGNGRRHSRIRQSHPG
jgi:hypothetical protein